MINLHWTKNKYNILLIHAHQFKNEFCFVDRVKHCLWFVRNRPPRFAWDLILIFSFCVLNQAKKKYFPNRSSFFGVMSSSIITFRCDRFSIPIPAPIFLSQRFHTFTFTHHVPIPRNYFLNLWNRCRFSVYSEKYSMWF